MKLSTLSDNMFFNAHRHPAWFEAVAQAPSRGVAAGAGIADNLLNTAASRNKRVALYKTKSTTLYNWNYAMSQTEKWWPKAYEWLKSRGLKDEQRVDWNTLVSQLRVSPLAQPQAQPQAAPAAAAPAQQRGGASPGMQVPAHGEYERVRGSKPTYVPAGGKRY